MQMNLHYFNIQEAQWEKCRLSEMFLPVLLATANIEIFFDIPIWQV